MSLVKRNLAVMLAFVLALTSFQVFVGASTAQAAGAAIDKTVDVSGFAIRIFNAKQQNNKNNSNLLDFNVLTQYLSDDVLVPATQLTGKMGLVLKFDKSLNSLFVAENKKDRIIIQFPLNSKNLKVSYPQIGAQKGYYKNATHPHAAVNKNGTILVPLKFVAITLGYKWNFEQFQAAITPREVAGVKQHVDNFKTARTALFGNSYDTALAPYAGGLSKTLKDLENTEAAINGELSQKAHKSFNSNNQKKFKVVGDIDYVGSDYVIVRGAVYKYDLAKQGAAPQKIVNDEYVWVNTGNTGIINAAAPLEQTQTLPEGQENKMNIGSSYESSIMYTWGDVNYKGAKIKRFSESKSAAHVQALTPVLTAQARTKAAIKETQKRALASRDRAYQTVRNAYAAWIEENKASEVRLRYEEMIHNIRLAKQFGFIEYAEESISQDFNYVVPYDWYVDYLNDGFETLNAEGQKEFKFLAKEHYTRIQNNVDSIYIKNLKETINNQKLDGLSHPDAWGSMADKINNLVDAVSNNPFERTPVRKLKWIGDLQSIDELYNDDVFVINQQKQYANNNPEGAELENRLSFCVANDVEDTQENRDSNLFKTADSQGLGLCDPDLVINTAVNAKLMNLGVLALMERGSLDNKDYDVAYFLVHRALSVNGNPYKAQLQNSKKQIELRFMRYDNYWLTK